jgi:hypothetical protein
MKPWWIYRRIFSYINLKDAYGFVDIDIEKLDHELLREHDILVSLQEIKSNRHELVLNCIEEL